MNSYIIYTKKIQFVKIVSLISNILNIIKLHCNVIIYLAFKHYLACEEKHDELTRSKVRLNRSLSIAEVINVENWKPMAMYRIFDKE